ncbi:MAG: MopE-related protein [Myxococcota bacterium]
MLLLLLACTGPVTPAGDEEETTSDSAPRDADGDGFLEDDCDADRADVHPGAIEHCDGVDNDCDGLVDDADDDLHTTPGTTWYTDGDADGYGAVAIFACEQPADTSAVSGDCDDADDRVNPGVREGCDDGVDENCDGAIDEECTLSGLVGVAEADAILHCRAARATTGYYARPSAPLTGDTPDLVVACQGTRTEDGVTVPARVAVLPGDVRGEVVVDEAATFVAHADETFEWSDFATAELTGDERLDLVAVARELCLVAVFAGPLAGEATLADAARTIDLDDCFPFDPGFLAAAGDLDGDGREDLLVGTLGAFHSEYYSRNLGQLLVMPGGGGDAAAVIVGTEEMGVGGTHGSADVNADGFDDLIVGPSTGVNGGVGVFFGPLAGAYAAEDADVRLLGSELTDEVAALGDVDADGYADLAVGMPSMGDPAHGAVYVVSGPPVGGEVDAVAAAVFSGEGYESAALGTALDGPGDVDGDGHAELLVGAPELTVDGHVDTGAAFLLYGPLSGTYLVPDADTFFTSAENNDWTGYAVGRAGDVDEDGYAEIFVGTPNYDFRGEVTGALFLFDGGPR